MQPRGRRFVCQGSSINDSGRPHSATGITFSDWDGASFQSVSLVFIHSFIPHAFWPTLVGIWHSALSLHTHTQTLKLTVCSHSPHAIPDTDDDNGRCLPVCHSVKLSVHLSVTGSHLWCSYLCNNHKLIPCSKAGPF